MAAQEDRFAVEQINTPQAVLQMPDKAQPGRAIASGFASIVLREHAADDVFVDIDAKGPRDLLGDAGTADPAIAALELDDRVDEFLRWERLTVCSARCHWSATPSMCCGARIGETCCCCGSG